MAKRRKRYVLIDRRQPSFNYFDRTETTGVHMAFDFIIGLGVFGVVWSILNPVAELFNNTMVVSNQEWAMLVWRATLVVYLIFSSFRFLSGLREKQTLR
jgi:hypothetical protein